MVFRHPFEPDAGIQVPAGTVEAGEDFETAVRREVWEETGLEDVELVGFLGEQIRDMSDYGIQQVHHQQFFHLRCIGHPPEIWRHVETDPSDGSGEHVFEFYWVDLASGFPELIAEHGRMLSMLMESLFHLN